MSFGATIKRLRKEKGFTQDQLANLLNISSQAVSRWENNSAMPDISLLVPLANIFHVTTDALLEVNVEETENQIRGILENSLEYDKTLSREENDDLQIGNLRDAVRRYPQDVRLKRQLAALLEHKIMLQDPNPDPALFREQIDLLEDAIRISTVKERVEADKTHLAYLYTQLKNPERVRELADEASDMKNCREFILPNALTGEAQVRARKNLIFKCTDEIIRTIHSLYEENAEDLTDQEWRELDRARHIVETVYGKDFSDHYMLVCQIYSRVHGAVLRNNMDEAYDILEDIIRRLKIMETGEVPESSLLLDTQHESLCLLHLHPHQVPHDADYILKRIAKDFDLEKARKENPRFERICNDLEELTRSDGGVFKKYCKDKFLQYTLEGTWKKDNDINERHVRPNSA